MRQRPNDAERPIPGCAGRKQGATGRQIHDIRSGHHTTAPNYSMPTVECVTQAAILAADLTKRGVPLDVPCTRWAIVAEGLANAAAHADSATLTRAALAALALATAMCALDAALVDLLATLGGDAW